MILQEILLLITLFTCICIFLVKVINIISLGERQAYFESAIYFIVFLISWGLGFISYLSVPTSILYSNLFNIENMFLMITSLIFFIETILFIKNTLTDGRTKYNPDK